MPRTLLRVTGTVQGVGFRPFVYRHAVALGLVGTVRNDRAGVLIDVQGDGAGIAALERALTEAPPPMARVTSVVTRVVPDDGTRDDFRIIATDEVGPLSTAVSVDTATCDDCLADVDDPANRRYRYPFTNCTNCGPRYTITRHVPYDRPTTTMAEFTMCASCRAEYDDPADRRFHAQPNACPVCGPRLSWRDDTGAPLAERDDALDAALVALRAGAIVGVKGIGGFHLAALAHDEHTVRELRRRKARDDKPFAVMVPDVDAARLLCTLDARAVEALTSPARPIVICARRADAPIAPAVAPGSPDLGVFLPYSPLHHLLLRGTGAALVMTSGNRSDDPIAHTDDDAVTRLGGLVDGFLTHDRPIHIRCDDSVVRATPARVQVLRRSRGYAPEPLCLPGTTLGARAVLAVGGELKSTVAVTRGREVIAGHHLGDLEHLATYTSFLQSVTHLPALYGVTPELVAHDLHPEYLSSKFARDLDVPTVGVQHHHAHVAACMVEHQRRAPVVALAFDGLGYGPDGTLWGGEVLVADFAGYERVGHLRAVPMPGGAAAIREPWRMAAVWSARATGAVVDVPGVEARRVAEVLALADGGKSLTTTSMGRLFDAAAVLLGGRPTVTYEAQAAIELEWCTRRVARADVGAGFAGLARVERRAGSFVLDPAPLLARLIADRAAGVPAAPLAAAFHEEIGRASASLAAGVARERGIDAVALTGGVFQNARLTDIVERELVDRGLRTLVHERVPPNDGGLSIGQAAIAALSG